MGQIIVMTDQVESRNKISLKKPRQDLILDPAISLSNYMQLRQMDNPILKTNMKFHHSIPHYILAIQYKYHRSI